MAAHLASRPRWPFNVLSAAVVAISVLVPFAAGRPAAQSDASELPFLGPNFSNYPYAATICLGQMAFRDGCSQDSEKAYHQCMCTDSNHLTHSKAAAECMMLLSLVAPPNMTQIYDLMVDQCKSTDTPLSIFTLEDWLAWASEAISGAHSTTGSGERDAGDRDWQ
ncbi:unnamed protein product [Parascedosporium putredinis]|uniref:Extracellular membrane protein CFEM domain-containing protein n=1 Tax=Parascedosporium putredinis TaxID=1442378 RepID=A0A9P1H2R9_9PEZI|nr:unnamed protein product [Parascedosporium putredinis]CAI7995218.1 unnamed protein product [Parascedosporium putredinis]